MKEKIVCATLLVEKSPQALPLGAACVASSIKSRFENLEMCFMRFFFVAHNIFDKMFVIKEKR